MTINAHTQRTTVQSGSYLQIADNVKDCSMEGMNDDDDDDDARNIHKKITPRVASFYRKV